MESTQQKVNPFPVFFFSSLKSRNDIFFFFFTKKKGDFPSSSQRQKKAQSQSTPNRPRFNIFFLSQSIFVSSLFFDINIKSPTSFSLVTEPRFVQKEKCQNQKEILIYKEIFNQTSKEKDLDQETMSMMIPSTLLITQMIFFLIMILSMFVFVTNFLFCILLLLFNSYYYLRREILCF